MSVKSNADGGRDDGSAGKSAAGLKRQQRVASSTRAKRRGLVRRDAISDARTHAHVRARHRGADSIGDLKTIIK